ncbi:MAG: hypothetical protein ACRD7E_14285, partial [Bryobacteraceae bacterium]
VECAAAAFLIAMAGYTASYRRYFLQIPETARVKPRWRRFQMRLPERLERLESLLLPSRFQRAFYHFTLRALLRSEVHTLCIGAFTGAGLVIASSKAVTAISEEALNESSVPGAGLLSIPLIIAYFMLAGIRCSFELPAELRANWVFRMTVDEQKHEAGAVARKVMLSFLLPWQLGICMPAYIYTAGVLTGLLHTAMVLTLSLLLMDILLLRFRKAPFTCPLPALKNSFGLTLFTFAFGMYAFTAFASQVERWMLLQPLRFVLFYAAAGAGWFVLGRIRRDTPDVDLKLTFEDEPEGAVQTLNLMNLE